MNGQLAASVRLDQEGRKENKTDRHIKVNGIFGLDGGYTCHSGQLMWTLITSSRVRRD